MRSSCCNLLFALKAYDWSGSYFHITKLRSRVNYIYGGDVMGEMLAYLFKFESLLRVASFCPLGIVDFPTINGSKVNREGGG